MKLWLDSPLNPIDFEFAPTGAEWRTIGFDLKGAYVPVDVGDYLSVYRLQGAHQASITATGDKGSVSIRNVNYHWLTNWGFDNLLEVAECPSQPLPGIGSTTPQAPTAHILLTQVFTYPCYTSTSHEGRAQVAANIDFDARGSTDPNIEPLTYLWDFKDGHTATGAQVTHAFAEGGFYFVELTVTDPSGRSDKEIAQIQVRGDNPSNHRPVPVFTASKTNLLRPFTTASLWGDVSYDEDGDPIDHVWYSDFSQEPMYGSKVEMDIPTSTWVSLGVSDKRGGLNYTNKRFEVADYPGQDCEITYRSYQPGSLSFGMQVRLYNNTSSPVRNWQASWKTAAKLSNLALNNNDQYVVKAAGSQSFSVSGDIIPEYSWVKFDLYGASTSAVQDIGFKTQNGLKCIEHMPPKESQPPIAKISATTEAGNAPLKVNFSAEGSSDPEGKELVSYRWSFGDGTYGFGKTVSHTFESAGNYDVLLNVSTGPLTSSGGVGGALRTILVGGNQSIGCAPSISPTGKKNEFIIKAVYWHKNFSFGYSNSNEDIDPIHLSSGRITLSAPVVITQAATETGIKLNTPTDVISFSMNKQLQPGSTEGIRITAQADVIDNIYVTSCTFK
jgi:PKD repeat protein